MLYVALRTVSGARADVVAIDPISRTTRLVLRFEDASDISRPVVASDGALWVARSFWRQRSPTPGDGDYKESLLRIDRATGQWGEFPAPPGGDRWVWLMEPGVAGDVWLSSFNRPEPGPVGSKLFHVGSGGAFEEIGNKSHWVSGLAVGRKGTLWYTTEGRDETEPSYLVRVDPATGRHEPIDALGRPVSLAADPDGRTLWYVNFLERGRGSPRSLVRVDTGSTAPNTITAANVLARGLATFVNCRTPCRGLARITLTGRRRANRASTSRARRSVAVVGTRRFRAKAGTAFVRVRLKRGARRCCAARALRD